MTKAIPLQSALPGVPLQGQRAIGSAPYDRMFCQLAFWGMLLGWITVGSASTALSQRLTQTPLFFIQRHLVYMVCALLLFLLVLQIPLRFWQRGAVPLLLLASLLLGCAWIAGERVNGATRWLSLGAIHIQPAELSKLLFYNYLSDYLVRKKKTIDSYLWEFIKPWCVLSLLAALLLIQPDLGTVIVLYVTTLLLLFLVGAKLWHLLVLLASGCGVVVALVCLEPYRMRRILAFLNPWQDPYGGGYQLTQSLMAFGRGGLLGQGLGNSVQKLDYLPAAHTDFIFAVIAEELGYFGVAFILLLLAALIWRIGCISYRVYHSERYFGAFLALSIAIWLSLQVLINIGGTVGLLPIKGLTLPLFSYGGSSLLVMAIALAVVVRIDFEWRRFYIQAFLQVGR